MDRYLSILEGRFVLSKRPIGADGRFTTKLHFLLTAHTTSAEMKETTTWIFNVFELIMLTGAVLGMTV